MATDTSQYYKAKTGPNAGTTYTSFDVYKQYNQGQLDPVQDTPSPVSPHPMPTAPTTGLSSPAAPTQTGAGAGGYAGVLPNGQSANFLNESIAKQYGATPQTNPMGSPVVDQNLTTAFNSVKDTPPPQDQGAAAGLIAQATQQAQGQPKFYLPGKAMGGYAAETVYDEKGKPLSYDDFIKAGGKPDFSNVTKGNPPPIGQASPEIENFFQTSPMVQPSLDQLAEFLSPASTRKELESTMGRITTAMGEQAGLKLELMDVKRVMEGSDQDIRDEVEKVGGFATESQVSALTVGRNKTLLKRASMIQDQLDYMTDVINTNMTMYGFQKDMAQQEFQQRSFLLNYKQKNDELVYKATQDMIDRNIKAFGYDGLYQATQGDPVKIARLEKAMGLASGGLVIAAEQAANERAKNDYADELDMAYKEAQINEIYSKSGKVDTKSQIVENADGSKSLVTFDDQGNLLGESIISSTTPTPGSIPEATKSKIQASNEYKTIGALLPAVQTIKKYNDLLKKHGTVARGEAKGELDSAYGNAIAAWKTLAGLGALSGADFELADKAIPKISGGFFGNLFQKDAPMLGKLSGSLDNAVTQAENLTKRLQQLYPDATGLLEQQMDDIKVNAYPDKFKRGPDGQVYELTNKSSFNSGGSVPNNALASVPAKAQQAAKQYIPMITDALKNVGITSKNAIAYALATIEHETAGTFKPIAEYNGKSQAKKYGYDGGENYYGRGFIQLTHRSNYLAMGKKIGLGDQLAKNPDLALRPDISAKILAQFFKDRGVAAIADKGDFIGARKPVNGTDQAKKIAQLAQKYLKAIG